MNKKIKLFDVHVGKEEEQIINKVMHSHVWASGAGSTHVNNFEKEFEKYTGSKSCISVNSGTAALHLALSLIDLKNKEVILPSLSFVSTAHAIIYNGGKPVFVDVDPQSLCIDHKKVEKAITKKTKAIIPVHFGGMPSELNKIQKLCKKHNICLVEDAAHAAGSSYKNKKIGSHGDIVCFSFHPVKNLAMPTGGAITLNYKNNTKLKNILKSRRWCGISGRKGTKYDVSDLGWNYYMNEFSAAIGRVQLKKLNKTNKIRQKIAKQYFEKIKLERKMPFNKDCSFHIYWILTKNRNEFMKNMLKNDIETGIHYLPIHKMSYYNKKTSLPNTEFASKHIVSLPMHPNLSDEDICKIIRLTNKFGENF